MESEPRRKLYETEEHRINEESFALSLMNHWHTYRWVKTSPNWSFDYWITDLSPSHSVLIGNDETPSYPLRAIAELKCRSCLSTTFPSLLISLRKIDALRTWTMNSGYSRNKKYIRTILEPVVALICIRYRDKDMYYRFEQNKFNKDFESGLCWIERGGRTIQTRDAQDIEQVVHIDRSLFKEIKRSDKE